MAKNDKCCFAPKKPEDVDREFCLECQKESVYWCIRIKCQMISKEVNRDLE